MWQQDSSAGADQHMVGTHIIQGYDRWAVPSGTSTLLRDARMTCCDSTPALLG
jgi:hypothetical protein